MGKAVDSAGTRLRCVHCRNTETPLWRAGPDGPKTLCNACGVRYKKGKLALYKNKEGKLTAVKLDNALPVVVPPATKRVVKKASSPSPQSPAPESRRVVRKVPSESSIAAAVAKKPRSRTRRATAGQLPGRYATKTLPDSLSRWRSPTASPESPSSPSASPPPRDEHRFGLLGSPTALNIDEPSLYQFSETEKEMDFSDFAFLGLGGSGNADNSTLLSMPADPSSTEQFSFAFAELGRDASLAIDLSDRMDALRTLVQDRTKKVSRLYDSCVMALTNLFVQHERLRRPSDAGDLEDPKSFVRSFAVEQDVCFAFNSSANVSMSPQCSMEISSPVMLPERATYIAAVECFRGLMDSVEVVGFAEACMLEVIAEDVSNAVSSKSQSSHNAGAQKRSNAEVHETQFLCKPIPTRA